MDDEIKALQEEMKNLYGELRQMQVRLQLLGNRLHHLQKKKPAGSAAPINSSRKSV